MKLLAVSCWLLAVGAAMCGCSSSYGWRSTVPADRRTVYVPTFRNESEVMELGAIAARQVAREFQREGTFRLAGADTAALEVQGTIRFAKGLSNAYDRRTRLRMASFDMTAEALVSVIDKRTHKVLVDNRRYVAKATFTSAQDLTTAQRDASGRLMDDLSRQVVDDMLKLKF